MKSHVPGSQPQLFTIDAEEEPDRNTTVFLDNMSLPVHRWFRYSAGFSAAWVQQVVRSFQLEESGHVNVFDPFVGSGTTCIAAQVSGADAIGVESHPFVARVAQAKLNWTADPVLLLERARRVLKVAERPVAVGAQVPPLLRKCYPLETLTELLSIRDAIVEVSTGDPVDELLWLGVVAILRQCSPVGTAQWQYVLPSKKKSRVAEPYRAFQAQVAMMAEDMRSLQAQTVSTPAQVRIEDARSCGSLPSGWANLLITSPPYPNNYDYADATRVEMTFLGEVGGWGELQDKVRKHLVRSCSQHMKRDDDAEALLASDLLAPIVEELRPVFGSLRELRNVRAGRKAYDAMVVAYFHDLARTWHALRRVMAPGSKVCFVVGDSAPYGVHVPVDRWLGELALAAGFKGYGFEKLRDRNVKWRNRKHRVPLHEGRLWVDG